MIGSHVVAAAAAMVVWKPHEVLQCMPSPEQSFSQGQGRGSGERRPPRQNRSHDEDRSTN